MEFFERAYQQNPVVITRKIGDDVILVPAQQQFEDSENVFTLNDMAAGIWVQIDGITPLKIIKERIIEKFEVTSELAEKDLINFILQLENSNMVFMLEPSIDNKP